MINQNNETRIRNEEKRLAIAKKCCAACEAYRPEVKLMSDVEKVEFARMMGAFATWVQSGVTVLNGHGQVVL